MDKIQFGTDGWRAKTAETFTFPNVRRAAYGLGKVLRLKKKNARVFVGYDTRFFSDRFAKAAAEVLASLGHKVTLSSTILPTPALSLAVAEKKADAGVMITASHNSAAYNGFKIKLPPGVSAPTEFTKLVEKNIPAVLPMLKPGKSIGTADWLPFYLKAVKGKVDLPAIRKSGLKVAVDSMGGVGLRHFEEILSGGKTKVTTVAGERDVFFGDASPSRLGRT